MHNWKTRKRKKKKIYELAEVYHSENIEKVSDELIEQCNIKIGDYDIISECKYRIPTIWKLGRIYQRLIIIKKNI